MNEKEILNPGWTAKLVSPQTAQEGLSAQQQSPAGSQPTSERKDPLVIAIANQKGGVAKTTTVVSLGGALANHGKEALVIDLDAQANLTLALGKDPERLRGAITDVLFHSATLLSVSRETSIPGLDLVPSNSKMDLAERFLPVRKDYENILQHILNDELRRNKSSRPMIDGQQPTNDSPASASFNRNFPVIEYDYVILDCPPFMGAVTLNALVAADLLIIPTQPEYFSAHALRTMMAVIRQVRSQHNPQLAYRILITLFDKRNRIHRQVQEQINQAFGVSVFDTVIGLDTKLRESAIEGVPISHLKIPGGSSRSALQYEALAQEIIQYDWQAH